MIGQYLLNMRFAEEILLFLHVEAPLVFGFEASWEPKLTVSELDEQMDVTVFDKEIGYAVFSIIDRKLHDIVLCYEDFLKELHPPMDDVYVANFARRALKIAPFFFDEGYTHGAFLGYCAMVLGVAYQFLLLKPNSIPKLACQIVGHVLFTHQMTGQFYQEGGWKGLYNVSFKFNFSLENSQNKKKKSKHLQTMDVIT